MSAHSRLSNEWMNGWIYNEYIGGGKWNRSTCSLEAHGLLVGQGSHMTHFRPQMTMTLPSWRSRGGGEEKIPQGRDRITVAGVVSRPAKDGSRKRAGPGQAKRGGCSEGSKPVRWAMQGEPRRGQDGRAVLSRPISTNLICHNKSSISEPCKKASEWHLNLAILLIWASPQMWSWVTI